MEQNTINQLLKKLSFLGYYPFQIQSIIQEATDNSKPDESSITRAIIKALKRYEKLGHEYLLTYSK